LALQALTYGTRLWTFIGNVLTRSVMATIVIVEDEPQISALVQSFIEEQGHKVLSAATADEALEILKGPEAVDALFVDIILKGDMEAGIELAKLAVELKHDLKVLYSTGLTVTEDMKALVVPGSIILEKPYSEDQLLASLSVLRGASQRSV
jgi:DNA-binding response OmpR family regulator